MFNFPKCPKCGNTLPIATGVCATCPISPLPGQEDQSARLAASAEVDQVEGTNSLEQFQRWLETEAHTAYQQSFLGFGHESFQDEIDRCRNAAKRIAKLRSATELLLDFKDQAFFELYV